MEVSQQGSSMRSPVTPNEDPSLAIIANCETNSITDKYLQPECTDLGM
jgi:hypothetical protein